jgi:hypothetical protein
MSPREDIPGRTPSTALSATRNILRENAVGSILNFAHLQEYINNYPPNDLNEEHCNIDFAQFMTRMTNPGGRSGTSAGYAGGVTQGYRYRMFR